MTQDEMQSLRDDRRWSEAMVALDAARQAYRDARIRVDEQAPDAMAALDDAMRRYERAVELVLEPRVRATSPEVA